MATKIERLAKIEKELNLMWEEEAGFSDKSPDGIASAIWMAAFPPSALILIPLSLLQKKRREKKKKRLEQERAKIIASLSRQKP